MQVDGGVGMQYCWRTFMPSGRSGWDDGWDLRGKEKEKAAVICEECADTAAFAYGSGGGTGCRPGCSLD